MVVLTVSVYSILNWYERMILIDDTSSVYIQRMNMMYKGEYTEVNIQYTEKMRKSMDNDLGDLLDLCNLVSLFYHTPSRRTAMRESDLDSQCVETCAWERLCEGIS
ncbi:unnamed protein product [Brassica napus]|uniref:(rape) hypothetical protein n=1 Tax=Brassica napus TaxID=3708 RepID=A0A816Q2U9_BRANA|nr:unnamed protein product [Brassica napus]